MRKNWEVIKSNRDLHFSLTQLTIIQGLVFIILALGPALSQALLHVPIQKASHAIIIPIGVGMIMGVLVVTHIAKLATKASLIRISMLAASITLILVGLSGLLWRAHDGQPLLSPPLISAVVGVLMFALGFLNAVISSAAQTLLQESTTDENRGKVFGSLNMLVNLAATLPIFLAGLLSDLFSVTRVIDVLGLALLVYSLYALWHYNTRDLLPKRSK